MTTNKSTKGQAFVVEDEPAICMLLQHLLERQGYQVQIAIDGQQALTRLSAGNPPGLILLDIILPFIDGFELIRCIRQEAGWEAVPIIVLTSKAQERSIVRALEAGANDYVVKPFQPEELMARVRRLIK